MDLQSFTAAEGFTVRAVIKGGETWFVARDVCDALEIADGRQAVDRLDEDERGGCSIPTPGGVQEVRAVSEAGLYSLVLSSRKPDAKKFKRWVTHDVIPSIRQTGAYSITQTVPAKPLTRLEILNMALESEQRAVALEAELEAARPAVEFMERYVDAEGTQPIRVVAKIVGMKERAFIAFLEKQGILYRMSGRLTPNAIHMEKGRFEIKAGEANGHAYAQPRFTAAGIEWITQRLRVAVAA